MMIMLACNASIKSAYNKRANDKKLLMLASSQPSLTSVRRDAWVEVDLSALENNLRIVSSWLQPNTGLMAVVKSDGYGHGACGIAPVLAASGAKYFGVASVDEGCQLRAAGIKTPILVLSPSPFWALSTAIEAGLEITVTSATQVKDVASTACKAGKTASVHLKVDTGMHRLGVSAADLEPALQSIKQCSNLELKGIFSHLHSAELEAETKLQNQLFQHSLTQVVNAGFNPPLRHLASGQAAYRFADTHYDLARVGLFLYGLEPATISQVVSPVLSLRARINHLQDIPQGDSVGYGHTWTAAQNTRLASIPVGYADGVDRRLSNRMQGLLGGKVINQVGTISMDQMLFDVSGCGPVQPGDVITLIGQEKGRATAGSDLQKLHLATWAQMLDTITYELVCRLRVRLPRIYTRSKTGT